MWSINVVRTEDDEIDTKELLAFGFISLENMLLPASEFGLGPSFDIPDIFGFLLPPWPHEDPTQRHTWRCHRDPPAWADPPP